MVNLMRRSLIFLPVLLLVLPSARAEDRVRFNRDIRPILSQHCLSCHGPDRAARKAGLRLDDRDIALQKQAIVPGHPDKSEMIARILADDPKTVMPPPRVKKTLSAAQKELLRRWVREGAEYEPHWSFQSIPRTVPVPALAGETSWIRDPLDAFVLDRLRREKLEPAPESTREAWLRRVTFDLTGLPPTLEELDAFLTDKALDAHDRVVRRLLSSPAYGERMANDWLDVARYADTFGYQADRLMHVWPWRDWVIRAFQNNLPYDQFVLWQTAGDLLPGEAEQKLATAFNRLHRQTNEGGSIAEEFRAENVADRLRTNGLAFLGLTLECARCHDHKFDPISTRDYYRLSAFFNNIDEFGLYSHFTETAPTPAMLLYQKDQEKQHHDLLARIRAGEDELRAHALKKAGPVPDRVEAAVPKPTAHFTFDDGKTTGGNRSVPGKFGKALEFDGDTPHSCPGAGAYGRTQPFSIALWVMPAELQSRAVILHRSRAAEDSAFRGYSLVLDQGYPVVSLVHFWPGNALRIRAKQAIPLHTWTHVAFTYDGSSKAGGLRLFVNGRAVEVEVVRDRLTRDIIHRPEWGDYDSNLSLTLGARFRDVGFRNGRVDDLQIFDRELSAIEVARVVGFEAPADEASRREHQFLHDPTAVSLRQELRKFRDQENDLVGKIPQIMVMEEMPGRRPTHVLYRGSYDSPKEKVEPDVPAAVLPFPESLPRNRLGLARWLLDDRHPLTARVAVNRIWQIFFQQGLVVTAEDFGSQGTPPTHPELLDRLARDFMNSGWNVKELCRRIVLSSTYRQSSRPKDPTTLTRDPDNALLARGPHGRLSAEMIRDNALAISGLLVRKVGGPSVFPYQPAGLWEESGTNQVYHQSRGEGLYRRSLYTFRRRTSPPPALTAFDAPSREWCLARRERTATPLQALVLLNDPQFVEAARVLAEKLMHQPRLADRLTTAFRLATSRYPSAKELALLTQMYQEQKDRFEKSPLQAEALLAVGETPRSPALPPAEHAAMTVVTQAVMNLGDCLTRK
jgi:hypothetical protein